jgi:hypothetical protein
VSAMSSRKIQVIKNRINETVEIFYTVDPVVLTVRFADGTSISRSGNNIFECFSQIRALLPNIVFLCKGAKRNVYPSRVSSQMASGLLAYEFKMGEQALKDHIVNIFDHDEVDIVESPEDQAEFFKKWLGSLK